ncbi:hypothetical protein SNEBB_009400 [Seison nebaliae]|nr:hypothetical protein SNEBB_009400 [Seison nebaliae]
MLAYILVLRKKLGLSSIYSGEDLETRFASVTQKMFNDTKETSVIAKKLLGTKCATKSRKKLEKKISCISPIVSQSPSVAIIDAETQEWKFDSGQVNQAKIEENVACFNEIVSETDMSKDKWAVNPNLKIICPTLTAGNELTFEKLNDIQEEGNGEENDNEKIRTKNIINENNRIFDDGDASMSLETEEKNEKKPSLFKWNGCEENTNEEEKIAKMVN